MNLPDRIDRPGEENGSSAQVFGELLRDEMNAHKDFYFFSPDETTSNRLATVFEASERAWARDVEPWDQHLAKGGRVIEMLSENTLFAVLAGHILSGGRGCMTSYEAFLPIVSSQLDQHLKFLKQSKTIEWREDVNALNITSFDPDEETGITLLPVEEEKTVDVYSVGGMKVGKAVVRNGKVDLQDLPKGIYVVNGKKIIK